MSDVIISPNMLLPVPIVGQDVGPDWASNYNACLSVLDQHNHSANSGVQISQDGINLTASGSTFDSLSFNGSNAYALRSSRYTPQVSALALVTDIGCTYVAGVDLYYNDSSGNQIRLTQGGSIVGTAGSITGLPSGTASASFAAGTFVWQSATNTAADMDAGSYILRNSSASSFGLTLNPPNAMGADYDLYLPSLPGSTKIMAIDTAGNMSGLYSVDNSTIDINGSNELEVKNGGITSAKMAASAITDSPVNIGVLPSVAANALTLTITDQAGSTPSATSPVKIPYRNATAGVGEPTVVSTTGSLAITVAQGSTLGCPTGLATYIYLYTINNSGANEAAISHALYDDGTITSTTTQVSGADTSPYLIYSATGRSNVPVKLIARILVTNTSGNWGVPSEVSTITPNTAPGPILATYYGTGMSFTPTTPTIFNFATKIQDTAGSVATGVAWKFTAPEKGLYAVSSNVLTVTYSGTVGDLLYLQLYKNGSFYEDVGHGSAPATGNTAVTTGGCTFLTLNRADYIDIRGNTSTTGAILACSVNFVNFISIAKVA